MTDFAIKIKVSDEFAKNMESSLQNYFFLEPANPDTKKNMENFICHSLENMERDELINLISCEIVYDYEEGY